MRHALVVDDNADAAEMMAALISAEGFSVAVAGSLVDARRQIALRTPDVVLLDLELPDGSGLELIEEAKAGSIAEVVLITGSASVKTSVQALRLGAADYLTKPLSSSQLTAVLSRLKRPSTLNADANQMEEVLEKRGNFGLLWGRSPPMRRVFLDEARDAPGSVALDPTARIRTCVVLDVRQHILHGTDQRPRLVGGDRFPAGSVHRGPG